MKDKKERFVYCRNLFKVGVDDKVFADKTGEVLGLALSYVEEDYSEELRDIVEEILNSPLEYELDDDFMQELLFEWVDIDDVLNWSGTDTILDSIAEWIVDLFFDKLNANYIKVYDNKEDEE